jgi:hypothetical protein
MIPHPQSADAAAMGAGKGLKIGGGLDNGGRRCRLGRHGLVAGAVWISTLWRESDAKIPKTSLNPVPFWPSAMQFN